MKMKIFLAIAKVDGDKLYIKATHEDDARNQLLNACGFIPDNIYDLIEVEKLPSGEVYL